jgi:hypothetical protein
VAVVTSCNELPGEEQETRPDLPATEAAGNVKKKTARLKHEGCGMKAGNGLRNGWLWHRTVSTGCDSEIILEVRCKVTRYRQTDRQPVSTVRMLQAETDVHVEKLSQEA